LKLIKSIYMHTFRLQSCDWWKTT